MFRKQGQFMGKKILKRKKEVDTFDHYRYDLYRSLVLSVIMYSNTNCI